jgi:hypothetical protein
MRQRPLTCGHPDGPRELERLVPDCRGMCDDSTLAYGMNHGIGLSGQRQTGRQKEAKAL